MLPSPRNFRLLSYVLLPSSSDQTVAGFSLEVRLAKGWVFRAVCRPVRKLKRPNWRLLRGSGEAAQTARAALSAELDRRVAETEPTSWAEVVDLGLGVARAVLGDEPCRDPRPWVRGCEGELQGFDQAVTQASSRKRKAESEAEFRAASYAVRRCKRRRSAWLREMEVSWWDSQAQLVQDKADQGDAFGVFATFKELRNRLDRLMLRLNVMLGLSIFG